MSRDSRVIRFTAGEVAVCTQIVVANMNEVYVQRSEPILRTIPETLANYLTVVVQAYSLVGVIVRHSAAVQTITGSAYPTNPTFA